MVELYQNGFTIEQLAEKLVRKPRSVKDKLSSMDVLKPPKKKLKGFERAGEPWLEGEEAQLMEYLDHGVPIEIIAKEMRRSDYSIASRIDAMGYEVVRFDVKTNEEKQEERMIKLQACPWCKRDDERLIHFYKTGMS